MKKIIFILILSFCLINNIEAKEKVTLNKCVDGDTAWFNLKDETIKTRFLAINAPESTSKVEEFGKEASEFTCNVLENAKKIEIEYDENSDKLDKYDRHLVWVFVDNELLQDLIIKEGLAKVDYLYDDYKYTSQLKQSELLAKTNQIGIWNGFNYGYYILGIVIIVIVIIIACFNKRIRKKLIKKTTSKIEKEVEEYIDKL